MPASGGVPVQVMTKVRLARDAPGWLGKTVTVLTPGIFSKLCRTMVWRPGQPVSPTLTRSVSARPIPQRRMREKTACFMSAEVGKDSALRWQDGVDENQARTSL